MVKLPLTAFVPRLPRSALARCAVAMLLALSATGALSAKNSPFGMEFIPPHFPDSTTQDAIDTLDLSAQVGGHSSFVWHWSDRVAFAAIPSMVSAMRNFGLKSFIQVGAIFINAPGPPDGYVKSFGNPQVRALYLSDVAAIAASKPDYMVFATEINLLHRFNRAEFEKFRSLYFMAASTVKTISPGTKVGLSFLYSLWYFNHEIEHVDVPGMFYPLDFIAFTTYPEWLIREGHYASIADIPPEFHGAARTAYPNARIVFSEVGWASKVQGTPEEQSEFVRNIPRLFSTARPELITWAVMHDMEFYNRSLINEETTLFLEGLGVDIDALFGHFNAMGLRDGFGNPKPGWYDAMGLEFPPP